MNLLSIPRLLLSISATCATSFAAADAPVPSKAQSANATAADAVVEMNLNASLFEKIGTSADAGKNLLLDASSSEKMQESFFNIMMSLDDSTQQKFGSAMTTIGLVYTQRPELGGSEGMRKLIDGRNADKIIAEARRLTSFIKQNSSIVDGRSADAFGRTVGEIMVGLEGGKQTKFSEALAKLMYENQKRGDSNETLIKKLDGKTADEIIEAAAKIDSPFPSENTSAGQAEYKISPLGDDEMKKYNLAPEKSKEPQKSLDESLSPESLLE